MWQYSSVTKPLKAIYIIVICTSLKFQVGIAIVANPMLNESHHSDDIMKMQYILSFTMMMEENGSPAAAAYRNQKVIQCNLLISYSALF